MFVLAGQFQRLAQMRGIFIAIKARLVRGDLEQHTTRRAEIDCMEIIAVNDRRDLIASV